jgi:uncharacterized membrane protein YidH (DUF202 family)
VKARKQANERDLAMAWNIASLSAIAAAGKLQRLDHYLGEGGSTPQVDGQALLKHLQAMKARGIGMTIERVPPRNRQH